MWLSAVCRLYVAAIIALSAAPAQASQAFQSGEVISGPIGARLDSILRRAETLGYSGQVVVERNGSVLLSRAYGYRDWARADRYTVDTPTGIASVSKMLAAVVVLRLVDQAKLSLTDTLGALLPSVPSRHAGISVHQLLTHTSGLPGGYLDPGQDTSLAASAQAILAVSRDTLHLAKWRYSSEGYVLLAAIVERRTGMPWSQVIQREVLGPAHMTGTVSVSGGPLPAGAAHSYVDWREATRRDRRLSLAGAGDLYSTPGDLLRFSHLVRRGTLLSERSWRLLATAQTTVAPGYGFGYGVFLRQAGATPAAVEHGGDDLSGPAAFLGIFFDPDVTLILTSNARDHQGRWWRRALGARLEQAIFADSAAGGQVELTTVAASERRALAGTYAIGTGHLHLIDTGAGLVLAARGQDAIGIVSGDTAPILQHANRLVAQVAESLLAGRYKAAFSGIAAPASRGALAQWWAQVERAWGRLHRAEVTGSSRIGARVATQLVFHHERGTHATRVVTDSSGVLSQLDPDRVSRWALAMPVAREKDGAFRAEDPFTGDYVRFRWDGARLLFGDTTSASRTAASDGLPGWVPP